MPLNFCTGYKPRMDLRNREHKRGFFLLGDLGWMRRKTSSESMRTLGVTGACVSASVFVVLIRFSYLLFAVSLKNRLPGQIPVSPYPAVGLTGKRKRTS